MIFNRRIWLLGALLLGGTSMARAQNTPVEALPGGWRVEHPLPGVSVMLDDNNNWGGSGDKGTTHQDQPDYWIEKTLQVPESALQGAKQARLRVMMSVTDYSQGGDATKPANGLDESFELVVNGQSQVHRMNEGFPGVSAPGGVLKWDYFDFLVPIEQIKPGANTFLFRKVAGNKEKSDDFLYIGIDNSIARGHSRMSGDAGKTWSNEILNKADARGEYMMRLILLQNDLRGVAEWTPRATADDNDLFGYAAFETGNTPDDRKLRIELDGSKIDTHAPLRLTIDYQGPQPKVESPGFTLPAPKVGADQLVYEIPQSDEKLSTLEIGAPGTATITKARLEYGLNLFPGSALPTFNIAPTIAASKGRPASRRPAARRDGNTVIVENSLLRAQFEVSPSFKLVSLQHELLQKNILAHPELAQLFQVEVDDAANPSKRYSAADWKVQDVKVLTTPQPGVAVELRLPQHDLAATLTIGATDTTLRWGLKVTNIGTTERTWKTAFPCLSGLQLSANESDDYYLFPYKGGIIAPLPSYIRSGYGEDSAWWQMIDVYSPTGGAGLSLRADDANGMYKAPVLRKGLVPAQGANRPAIAGSTDPKLIWLDSLAPAPGTAMAIEYLARKRGANASFAPPDAVIEAHDGDWQNAMRNYVTWAQKTWKWRRFSSRLDDVWNIGAIGWGADRTLEGGTEQRVVLFRDGKFRTDYLSPNVDVQELYGWWEWSDKAPWGVPTTPDDQLKDKMGPGFYDVIKSYIGKDGATNQIRYSQNMGDYKYHESWGGLPALKNYIADLKKLGTSPMLYTCPVLIDANSDAGQKYGAKYGMMHPTLKPAPSAVVTPEGYLGQFGSWNMCTDNEFYPKFVGEQMTRIAHDTGTDGIRMDVFGYPGYACSNPNHQHIYAEPGHNEYMRGTAEAARLARAGMEKEAPGASLTTEYPGYDYMFHNLDGAIVYETSWFFTSNPVLRGIPFNMLRFFFPTFKPFDLDDLDPKNHVPGSMEYRFWNGLAAFGVVYTPNYHRILKENGDAFNEPGAQPFIPTLQEKVYANRFKIGAKSLTTILNARPFTVDGPVINLLVRPYERVFDLLNGREIQLTGAAGTQSAVRMRLRPREVTCLAQMPKRISEIRKAAAGWTITLADKGKAARRLELCAADGTALSTQEVSGQSVQVAPASADAKQPAVYVKLFEGKYLIDAAALPIVTTP